MRVSGLRSRLLLAAGAAAIALSGATAARAGVLHRVEAEVGQSSDAAQVFAPTSAEIDQDLFVFVSSAGAPGIPAGAASG